MSYFVTAIAASIITFILYIISLWFDTPTNKTGSGEDDRDIVKMIGGLKKINIGEAIKTSKATGVGLVLVVAEPHSDTSVYSAYRRILFLVEPGHDLPDEVVCKSTSVKGKKIHADVVESVTENAQQALTDELIKAQHYGFC